MKSFISYLRDRNERKLRERCLHYSVELLKGTHPNSETLRVYAQRCYEFIVKEKL